MAVALTVCIAASTNQRWIACHDRPLENLSLEAGKGRLASSQQGNIPIFSLIRWSSSVENSTWILRSLRQRRKSDREILHSCARQRNQSNIYSRCQYRLQQRRYSQASKLTFLLRALPLINHCRYSMKMWCRLVNQCSFKFKSPIR